MTRNFPDFRIIDYRYPTVSLYICFVWVTHFVFISVSTTERKYVEVIWKQVRDHINVIVNWTEELQISNRTDMYWICYQIVNYYMTWCVYEFAIFYVMDDKKISVDINEYEFFSLSC